MAIDNDVYKLLNKSLDAATLRGRVISNNIANVNTKNYKKYYVSFEETFNKSLDKVSMKTTNDKHINSTASKEGEITIKQDNSTSMRTDGNNVDIENEMANQAANALLYNAMINQVNSRLTNTRNVINGGR